MGAKQSVRVYDNPQAVNWRGWVTREGLEGREERGRRKKGKERNDVTVV